MSREESKQRVHRLLCFRSWLSHVLRSHCTSNRSIVCKHSASDTRILCFLFHVQILRRQVQPQLRVLVWVLGHRQAKKASHSSCDSRDYYILNRKHWLLCKLYYGSWHWRNKKEKENLPCLWTDCNFSWDFVVRSNQIETLSKTESKTTLQRWLPERLNPKVECWVDWALFWIVWAKPSEKRITNQL